MTDKVFIEPLDLSAFGGPAPTDSPGFTQLVQDVLGTGASEMDGFDAALADAAALVDALDKITGEQDAALDAILVSLDTSKPDALDNSMAGYVGTADAGAAIVADAHALAPPQLMELPLSPAIGGIIGAPPTQVSVDLGTHTVGSAQFTHLLGPYNRTKAGVVGVLTAQLTTGDPSMFSVDLVLRIDTDLHSVGSYVLTVNPAKAGVWIAQVETVSSITGVQIVTFTLTVVP